jgi:hypothetical protein
MLGERGPHLAAIPGGSDIFTATETRKLLAMGIPGFAGGKEGKRRKREKRLAKKEAARASRLLNLEAILAAAELTSGTADDTKALNALIGYWGGIERANKNAAKLKNPLKRRKGLERLLEARTAIKSYTDQLGSLSEVAGGTAGDSGQIEALKALLAQSSLRYAVSQAQGGVLRSTPYVGSFAGGGVVPGPIGSPGLAIVHGGETISEGAPVVNIQIANGMEWLKPFIRAEAKNARVTGVGRTPGNPGALR